MDQTLSTVFSRKWGMEEAGLELGERMRMMSSERLANLNMEYGCNPRTVRCFCGSGSRPTRLRRFGQILECKLPPSSFYNYFSIGILLMILKFNLDLSRRGSCST